MNPEREYVNLEIERDAKTEKKGGEIMFLLLNSNDNKEKERILCKWFPLSKTEQRLSL